MSDYTVELGEHVNSLICECCGQQKKRVWGFVSKDGNAHAVYYALLNVSEVHPRVGLSLSVGPWDDEDPRGRSWIHMVIWVDPDTVHLQIVDPQQSNFFPWESGGKPLTAEQASVSSELEEFRSVANFIVRTDPAVMSYLERNTVDASSREERELGIAANNC